MFPLPGTAAQYITKCSLFILMLINVPLLDLLPGYAQLLIVVPSAPLVQNRLL